MIFEKTKTFDDKVTYIGNLNGDFEIAFCASKWPLGLRIEENQIDIYDTHTNEFFVNQYAPKKLKSKLREFKDFPQSFECDLDLDDFGIRIGEE